jgi:hypothetical protein
MTPKKVIPGRLAAASCGILFCLIGLAFSFAPAVARAALQFDVFVGYDQILPEHGWFPVTCELHNDGPSFNAVIEVTAGDWGGGQVRRFPIDLPTNTRKRVIIPVYASGRLWNARLVDSGGHVRAEQGSSNLRVLGNRLPLVAGLARTVGGMPVFPEPANSDTESKYVAARLQPALFPDNPLALDGIDMLYVSSAKAADLSVGQVTAIMAWVQDGGHLVVGVEQLGDVNGTPWLRELLPCQLNNTVNITSHDALQQWVRTKNFTAAPAESPKPRRHPNAPPNANLPRNNPPGTARIAPVNDNSPLVNPAQDLVEDPEFDGAALQVVVGTPRDGQVLIGDNDTPLAFEGRRGRGRITVLGFSPEREPFLGWKNRVWFWARLADVPASAFQQQPPRAMSHLSSDSLFGAMIDSRQVRKLPLGWLLALLAAYLIVIGPLDQYWLKKINRQMLTWITFPCYVLIFSGLIYWIGFHLRAGELEWNELNLVDILPDTDRAVLRGETYVSIYSPVNAHYELGSDQPFATLRGESMGDIGGSIEGSRASLIQHGNNFDADAFVPVWTSQLYVSDWLQPSPLPLAMNVARDAAGWKVTVENKMDRALSRASVVLNGRIYTLGDLPANGSRTVTFQREEGQLLMEWASQKSGSFIQAAQSRRNSFGNNDQGLTDLVGSSMAASFLTDVNSGVGENEWQAFSGPEKLDLSRFADRGYGILLAWDADHSLTEPLNHFPAKRTHRNTLLRLVVPVAL